MSDCAVNRTLLAAVRLCFFRKSERVSDSTFRSFAMAVSTRNCPFVSRSQ